MMRTSTLCFVIIIIQLLHVTGTTTTTEEDGTKQECSCFDQETKADIAKMKEAFTKTGQMLLSLRDAFYEFRTQQRAALNHAMNKNNQMAITNGHIRLDMNYLKIKVCNLTDNITAADSDLMNKISAVNDKMTAVNDKMTAADSDLMNKINAVDEGLKNKMTTEDNKLRSQFKNEDNKLRSQFKSEDNKVRSQISGVQRNLQGQISNIKNENNRLSTRISNVERTATKLSKRVAFHAQSESGSGNIWKVMPYENVMYNVGNAFDGRSDKFRAPVSGLYYFAVNLTGGYLKMVRDGSTLTSGFANHKNWITLSIAVYLNAGNQVWVEGLKAPGYKNYFNGFLIVPW